MKTSDTDYPATPEAPKAGNIFDGTMSSEAIDTFESGTNQNDIGKTVAFEGSIDPARNMVFINPKDMVDVYVRPGRTFSQVIDSEALRMSGIHDNFVIQKLAEGGAEATYLPDRRYRVSRMTLNMNRAVLCERGEYLKIKSQMASPDGQRVQRQIEEMRAHQSTQSASTMTDTQRAREAELRGKAQAQAQAHDLAQQRQAEEVTATKNAREAAQRAEQDQRLETMDHATFERHLADLRSQGEALAARVGERGRGLLALIDQEEEDLRARYGRIQLQRAATRPVPETGAPASSFETKMEAARAALARGHLTQAEFDRQVALLLGT